MRWPRLTLPPDRRIRLISLAGAVVLVVLIATTVAVLLSSQSLMDSIGDKDGDPYGLQTGVQSGLPGSSPSVQARPSAIVVIPPTPVAASSGSPAIPASATYRTIALLGLGGFDTEVTVTNPSRVAWKILLTMPSERQVENLTSNLVKMEQHGTTVTLTPTGPAATRLTFTVRFPALLALGKSITACTIDGKACTAA